MRFEISICLKIMIAGLGGIVATGYEPFDNPWEKVTAPAKGAVTILGGYNAGCLAGASAIPLNGEGYQVIRTNQKRFYGTPELIDFIKHFGKKIVSKKIVALVGDSAMARGGPFTKGHASHQIGLDADFWFLQDPRALKRPLTEKERNSLEAVPLADVEANKLIAANWKSQYATMLFEASSDPRVERIFVHPAIKLKMCSSFANKPLWLSKLRPWWGHNYHFHVRLSCPSGATHCLAQDPVDDSTAGCDESLQWWFSDEWRAEYEARKKQTPAPQKLPVLPAACAEVLKRK